MRPSLLPLARPEPQSSLWHPEAAVLPRQKMMSHEKGSSCCWCFWSFSVVRRGQGRSWGSGSAGSVLALCAQGPGFHPSTVSTSHRGAWLNPSTWEVEAGRSEVCHFWLYCEFMASQTARDSFLERGAGDRGEPGGLSESAGIWGDHCEHHQGHKKGLDGSGSGR